MNLIRHVAEINKAIEGLMDTLDTKNNANILLVEDDPIVMKVHYGLLIKAGCKVDQAINGLQAIKMYNYQYDLIFLDCGLPDVDGFAICKKIRELEYMNHHKPIPIIMLSAYLENEEIKRECQLVGINQYVVKPVNKQTILHILRKWLPEKFKA